MNVLIDINVALDVFMARDPWLPDAKAIFQANRDGHIVGHLSAASFPTIFYILRRHAGVAVAEQAIVDCLSAFEVADVQASTLRLGQTLSGDDYEDRLQAASAIEARLDAIVTRDPDGFVGCPIAVLSPSDLLAKLTSDS